MELLTLAGHLAGFALPAVAVALAVALAARWLLRPAGGVAPRFWVAFCVNFAAGLAALAGGLVYFGRDGKMATYAALVLAVASAQWLASRGWRAR